MPSAENGISLSNRFGIPTVRKPAAANLLIFWTEKMYALAANHLFFVQMPQFG
jgi:hypothetical protein